MRSSNKKAVQVYKNFGYIVYEVLKDYYESEAAYGNSNLYLGCHIGS